VRDRFRSVRRRSRSGPRSEVVDRLRRVPGSAAPLKLDEIETGTTKKRKRKGRIGSPEVRLRRSYTEEKDAAREVEEQ
jgi:hypothetical protein